MRANFQFYKMKKKEIVKKKVGLQSKRIMISSMVIKKVKINESKKKYVRTRYSFFIESRKRPRKRILISQHRVSVRVSVYRKIDAYSAYAYAYAYA